MARDYFADDLIKTDRTGNPRTDSTDGVPVTPITDASLTRMVRQKEDMKNQAADAAKEIEHLRLKQEQLEKERTDLEQLTRKTDEYERAKRDIIDKLVEGTIVFEKEEVDATRMAELLSVMRTRFKDALDELRTIDEAKWPDGDYQLELNKAMVLVEDAKGVYKKALAKIEAAGWRRHVTDQTPANILSQMPKPAGETMDFWFWLKAGLAFCLPLICFLGLLFLLYLYVTGMPSF